MKILGLKKIEIEDEDDFDWEISFTLEGSSEVCYDYVQDKDEMQAYYKAIDIVERWQGREYAEQASQLQADLQGFKELKKLMPSADLSEDVVKAKKLLTGVNKRLKALNKVRKERKSWQN